MPLDRKLLFVRQHHGTEVALRWMHAVVIRGMILARSGTAVCRFNPNAFRIG
jgi:hypothetical protein